MISKIKSILKLFCRRPARHDAETEQEYTIIIISPGCGRGGSRKTKIVMHDKDPSDIYI
ncbi:MAG: hypothetical protein QM503_07955 [Bacteroidota bacterium]